MTTGFRLTVGWIDASLLTESYDIDLWPVQSDQDASREWFRPGNEADVVEETAELVTALSHNVGGYGKPYFQWKLRVLSPLMNDYVRTLIFPGGIFSNLVTVRTFDRGRGFWPIYWATVQRKLYKDGAELAGGGYDQLTLDFVNCTYKPQSFSSGFSRGFQ